MVAPMLWWGVGRGRLACLSHKVDEPRLIGLRSPAGSFRPRPTLRLDCLAVLHATHHYARWTCEGAKFPSLWFAGDDDREHLFRRDPQLRTSKASRPEILGDFFKGEGSPMFGIGEHVDGEHRAADRSRPTGLHDEIAYCHHSAGHKSSIDSGEQARDCRPGRAGG